MANPVPTKPSKGIGTEQPSHVPPTQPRTPADPTERDPDTRDHEGAREEQVSDRTGPAVGYDNEPEREKDTGGVS